MCTFSPLRHDGSKGLNELSDEIWVRPVGFQGHGAQTNAPIILLCARDVISALGLTRGVETGRGFNWKDAVDWKAARDHVRSQHWQGLVALLRGTTFLCVLAAEGVESGPIRYLYVFRPGFTAN